MKKKKKPDPAEPFCSFCSCIDCRQGNATLLHSKCADGRWICDVCYLYDVCSSGPDRNPDGPCSKGPCRHRPELVGEFCR